MLIYRDLVRDNPVFLEELTMALNNLGSLYIQSGSRDDALPLTEEAVRVYRDLTRRTPAHLPNLAMALNKLGVEYMTLGRSQDGLAATEEAIQLYCAAVSDNPAVLPHLAEALNNLASYYSTLDMAQQANAAWSNVLTVVPAASQAFLLIARAAAADAGNPDAALWLTSAWQADQNHRRIVAAMHDEARRHRAIDPHAFEDAWRHHSGQPIPNWLTVDPDLIATAKAWIGTETLDQEREFLVGHPELLHRETDNAVHEALLPLGEDAAQWYMLLRQKSRDEGVEAAYQPLLLSFLARQFTEADPDTQRTLLATRRDDLMSAPVRDTINSLADGNGLTAHRAIALLLLAALGEHEPILDALTEPSRFPSLLHDLACHPAPAALGPAAAAALTAAATPEQRVTGSLLCSSSRCMRRRS